jgi:hypothetical protein
MYSYTHLGKNGQLGNQMFQYAALYSLGFLRGTKIKIPSTGHDLLRAFPNLSATIDDTPFRGKTYQEPTFLFDPSIWTLEDGTDLFGYFQSPHYFLHCAHQINAEFTFHDEVQEIANKAITVLNSELLCAMHFRRKDYLNLADYHHNQDANYYNEAVSLVLKNYPNVKFIAFSDDVDWCKQNLPKEITVMDTRDQGSDSMFIDMCIMSKCQMHIIANSSFSWWGAFLSRSTGVIAPKKWFGPRGPKEWDTVYVPDRQHSALGSGTAPGWTKL